MPEELKLALKSLGIQGFNVEVETSRLKDGMMVEMRVDSHPSVVYVNYESIVPEVSENLQPRVKIEISCLLMDEAVEEKELRSLIAENVPDVEDMAVRFKTVVPTRTFLEKVFLLHEEFQREKLRSYRMSRHLYDLEKIMDSPFGKEALADKRLYMDIVEHRSKFNKLPSIDNSSHAPTTINIIPPENVAGDWRADYENMRKFLSTDTTHCHSTS